MNDVSVRWRRFGVALLALAAAWGALGSAAPETSGTPQFGLDEAEYLAMGAASVAQALGETDASLGGQVPGVVRSPWRNGYHATTFGFQSPGLPKLLFGLIARSSGVEQVDALVWKRYAPKRLPTGQVKTQRRAARVKLAPALGPARELTHLVAALIAGLLAAAAHRIASDWPARPWVPALAGLGAALLWCSSPAALEAAHHVRPGLFPILFWCAALVIALEVPRGPRQLPLAAALGLAIGLATAGKLNGVLLAPLAPLALYLRGARRGQLAAATALAAALSFAVFVAFAPGLWHDTAGGIVQILDSWRADLAHQAGLVHADVAVPTGRLDALGLAFSGLATEAGPLGALLPYLGALLGLAGLTALARGARHSDVDRITLAWCLVLLVGSGLIMPFERLRYLTPLAAPTALAAALLLARLTAMRCPRASE